MTDVAVPRVAVVGAGPAGIVAADRIARALPPLCVDLIDARPAPAGLLRWFRTDRVRLLGNVTVGRDVTAAELASIYDAVLSTVPGISGTHADTAALLDALGRVEPTGAGDLAALLDERGLAHTTWTTGPGEAVGGLAEWRELTRRATGVPVCV